MMTEIRFQQDEIVCGSSTRRVLPQLVRRGKINFIPSLSASENDLVLCRVLDIPSYIDHHIRFESNKVERCYYQSEQHTFMNERLSKGLAICAVGNRYSALSFVGGLYNPITGEPNGEIHGGTIVTNLGSLNVVGFLNYNYGDEQPISIEVLGVLVDDQGLPMNLTRYREKYRSIVTQADQDCFWVAIFSINMETGKTTCAKAIASELNRRGYTVTYEKKTGGPYYKDLVTVFSCEHFGAIGTSVQIDIDRYPARDFLDATGCVTSHTVHGYDEFANQSLAFTCDFIKKRKSQFHIIEFAGNVSEVPNLRLLEHPVFRRLINAVVYCMPPIYEIAHQFYKYFETELGYDHNQTAIILSGEIGNEDCPEIVRKEISCRLGIPICRSVTTAQGEIVPFGIDLADQMEYLKLSRMPAKPYWNS